MPDSDETLPLSPSDSQTTESRMRRALGLQGPPSRQPPQQRADQVRPRHRFVQDGGVPVVVLNSRSDNDPTVVFKTRVAELETALETERTAHGVTRRSLQDSQAALQASQTRLAHAELAHADALATERRAREAAAEGLQAQLAKPTALTEQATASPTAAVPTVVPVRSKPSTPKTPRAPRVSKTKEPQPVRWWLPSFREKRHS